MMKPINVSQTGSGSTDPVPLNLNVNPFNVSMAVVVTGTVNYTVQYTFDDVWASSYDPATGTWFSHASLAGQTTSQTGNFAFPVAAVRLTVNSGSGTAAMTVIQAGIA
jgi:hypothetical protein